MRSLAVCLVLLACGVVLAEVPTAQQPTRCVSWNAYSRQFIDAPTFTLLSLRGTAVYRAVVKQGEQEWRAESKTPEVSLAGIWPKIAVKKFSLVFEWVDASEKVIAADKPTDRVKAPDFAGFTEPAVDWRAAADKGKAYLISGGLHGTAPYHEDGVPTWVWSAASPYAGAPKGEDVSYPCITGGSRRRRGCASRG